MDRYQRESVLGTRTRSMFHPRKNDLALFREIQCFKFRFSRSMVSCNTLRAILVENEFSLPEIRINLDHPHFLEKCSDPKDPLYESQLIEYVGVCSAYAFAINRFSDLPPFDMMDFLAEAFEASFIREWNILSRKRASPSLAMTKKFVQTGSNHIETRFSTPTLATTSRSPSSTSKSSSILSVDVETAKSNLYVCGIPRHWTKEDLRVKFSEYGEVLSVKIWSNRSDTQENAGSGFVQFVHHGDALEAVKKLNGTKLPDMLRPLLVKFADSCKKRNNQTDGENIYVSGLSMDFTDEKLHALFRGFGEIESVLVLPSKRKYKALTGFVRFVKRENAVEALKEMHRSRIENTNCIISCSWAKGNKSQKQGQPTNVYITGIDPTWLEKDIKDFFSHFGPVESVALMNPKGGDHSAEERNAIAFVKFQFASSAENCVATANGIRLPSMTIPLSVRFSKHQSF